MEKFPFTSGGATELVTGLYALPDGALQMEAKEANADFVAWLLNHFDFEPSQVTYLEGMSTILLSFIGSQVTTAIRHRLALSLVKLLPVSKTAALRDCKLIEIKSKIDTDGDGSGSESASGFVIVEISY